VEKKIDCADVGGKIDKAEIGGGEIGIELAARDRATSRNGCSRKGLRRATSEAETERGTLETKAAEYAQQIYVPVAAMRRLSTTFPLNVRNGRLTLTSAVSAVTGAMDRSKLARDCVMLIRLVGNLDEKLEIYDRTHEGTKLKAVADWYGAKMRAEAATAVASLKTLVQRLKTAPPELASADDEARDYTAFWNGDEHTVETTAYIRYNASLYAMDARRERAGVLLRELDAMRIQLMTRFVYSTTPSEVLFDDEGFPEAGIDEVGYEAACDARVTKRSARTTSSPPPSSSSLSSSASAAMVSQTRTRSRAAAAVPQTRTRSRALGELASERKTESKQSPRSGNGGGGEGKTEDKGEGNEVGLPGEKMCKVVAQWRADKRCANDGGGGGGGDEEAISAISTDVVPNGERMRLRFRVASGAGGHANFKTVVRCFSVADLKMLVARARAEETPTLDPESRVPLSDAQVKRIDERVPSQAALDTFNTDVWTPFRNLLHSPTRSLEVVQERTYLARLLYWLRQGSPSGIYDLTDKTNDVTLFGARYSDDLHWIMLATHETDPDYRNDTDKPPPIGPNTRRQSTYHA
jgi:hypothetical protein